MPRGPLRTTLGPMRYINVNFPLSDRELYEWTKRMAKRRRQAASQYVRSLLEAAKAEAEASDG